MKQLTNFAPGPRGVTLKPANPGDPTEIVWIEPGATASVDPKRIVEPLPDLGTKPADDENVDQIEALSARNAELEKQVGDLGAQVTQLTADLEKATKPASK